jgi:hypothetical protein
MSVVDSLRKAQQSLRKVVAGLLARGPWIDNIEVYLGLWCTKWHWDTSFLLFTDFPYHCLSSNADTCMKFMHFRPCIK